MNQICLICNSRAGVSVRNATSIFGDNTTLQSGKKLCEILSEITEKPIKDGSVHSTIICKKCYKSCVEYDEIQVRLKGIKMELLEQFKKTLPKHNLNYENYEKEAPAKTVIKFSHDCDTKKFEGKTIVLPASKLQPLPPDFVIKVGKLASVSRPKIIDPDKIKSAITTSSPSTLNLKVTVGSSVLTQSIKTTGSITNKIFQKAPLITLTPQNTRLKQEVTLDGNLLESPTKTIMDEIETTIANITDKVIKNSMKDAPVAAPTLTLDATTLHPNSVASILNNATTNSILSFNVSSLPKDFLSSAILTKVGGGIGDYGDKKFDEVTLKKIDDLENNDEQPMEIDEECSYTVVGTTSADKNDVIKVFEVDAEKSETVDVSKSDHSYLDVSLLQSPDVEASGDTQPGDKFIFGKVEVLKGEENYDDDDEEHTIVMEGENGSILRVVPGQKILYGDSEISLMVPAGDHEGDDGNADLDHNDNGDSQESNDESQIELQVSGDEETANAIIAAAQEQGGAFIKVESGEMFRVKSVQSKTEDDGDKVDHVQPIVAQDGNMFKCLLCEKNVSSEGSVRQFSGDAESTMRHMKLQHDARLYICRQCGLLVRRRTDYTQHIASHAQKSNAMLSTDKNKMHECFVCNKKYSSRTLVMEHMNVHNGTRPYKCHVCGKTFASKYTHQSHLKTHLDRPRPFKCTQCNKSFFTQQNLNQHEKTHSGVKDFVCNICGKAFGTQHNLEVHGVVHSGQRPFVCGLCGKGFARRAEVRDHMRVHTGERPFACETCGATFSQRSNLQSHRRATHLDDKRYQCLQCSKRFKRRRLLDYHIKASHTGERPLKCEVCRATFIYPEHYKKHVRIHSGEKPYVCEVCGKSFNSRDNRNTHRFVHSDKKPYECLVCAAGYMRKHLLYAHMNATGHLAESIVVNQPRMAKVTGNVISTQSVVVDTLKMKSDQYSDTVLEAAETQLETSENKSIVMSESDEATKLYITGDKKFILPDGKTATLNLVQDSDDTTLLTLHNIDGTVKSEGTLLEGVTAEQLGEHAQIVASDENESTVRLVQIQLPDGNSGWVAINVDRAGGEEAPGYLCIRDERL